MTINYKDSVLEVRSGAWLDIFNSWLFTTIDTIQIDMCMFEICQERIIDGGELFALVMSCDKRGRL